MWSDIEGDAIRVVQQKTGAKLWVPIHPTLARHVAEWRADKTMTEVERYTREAEQRVLADKAMGTLVAPAFKIRS